MQKKHVNKKNIITILVIFVLMPATLVVSWYFGNRKYYLSSVLIMIYAMIPFFAGFERRRPEARDIVTLAVMSAIAAASRVAFMPLPHFKPLVGITMISGMAFGPQAGFLTGAISGLVSNFVFGQGPWTPWQMFAYGIAGFIGAWFFRIGIFNVNRRFRTAIISFLVVLCIIGPILDTCAVFTMAGEIDMKILPTIYMSGVPVNAVHGIATALTLFFLGKPMMEKLDRIKVKYGMMDTEVKNEVR